jgi:hypothetical protein
VFFSALVAKTRSLLNFVVIFAFLALSIALEIYKVYKVVYEVMR